MHGYFQILAYYRRQPQILAVVQLRRSLHCGVNPNLDYSYSPSTVVMVSYYVTFVMTVYGEIFGEPNSPHKVSRGFRTS